MNSASKVAVDPNAAPDIPEYCHFAGFTFDISGRVLSDASGQEVPLRRSEFALLHAFIRQPRRVLSRDQLLDSVSGRRCESYDRSVDVLVSRLRRKIEPDRRRPTVIVTVQGGGYKFTAQVHKSQVPTGETSHSPGDVPPKATPIRAGRKQVTALSVELTSINGRRLTADPEELHATIEGVRQRVTAVVNQYGGVVAHCVTREILAYFGYPVAQEDATERATRAGLELVESSLSCWNAAIPPDVSIRVGIATGLVVAAPSGEIVGNAPGDAAQMRNLAQPGQVVVAASTRRIADRLFRYRGLGPATPGGGEPVRATAWQVLGPSPSGSRSEILYNGTLSPLIGREVEKNLLLHTWQQAKSREGRVMLVSGEPGIGKSRLLVEIQAWLAADPHAILRFFCSPLHQGSALHPFLKRWEEEAGFTRDDLAEARLLKLTSLGVLAGISSADLALLAELLGVSTCDGSSPPDLSPQRRREQAFSLLYRRFVSLAEKQPLLIIFEDANWADPSSLEFLDILVNQITELPILLLVSCRPEFFPPWIGRAGVTLVTLARLDRRQSVALAAQVTTTHALTPAALEHIIARADGVPLFIEELTRVMLDSASDGLPRALAIPDTLQGSLTARLDRHSMAKEVAQTAAVIGRQFSHNLLCAVAELEDAQLTKGLNALVAAGLIYRRGIAPEASYTFKHALVQEVAYESLLKTQRAPIHRRIAEWMSGWLPSQACVEPEVIAYHFTQADVPALAVEWWGKAGEIAMRRSAYAEAIAHLENALQLIDGLGDGSEQRRARLRLRITHGNALRVARGFGVPETLAAFAAARELAVTVDDVSERFPAYYGLWSGSFLRGDLTPMREMATAFLRDAKRNSPEAAIAHRISGMTDWYMGDFTAARRHLDRVLVICRGLPDCELGFRFGQDLASPAMAYLAQVLWALGDLDRAASLAVEAVNHALGTKHIPTIAYAHAHAATFEMMRRDRSRTASHLTALLDLAREHGISVWIAAGTFYDGWLRWDSLDREAGVAAMHEGMAQMRKQRQEIFMPLLMTLFAETETEAGRPDAALFAIDAQLAATDRTGQHWYLAELYRTRGEILLKCRPDDGMVAAECAFKRAIAIARAQSAKLFELHAALSLAHLWIKKGKRTQARDLIVSIFSGFGKGLNSGALREARTLLGTLSP